MADSPSLEKYRDLLHSDAVVTWRSLVNYHKFVCQKLEKSLQQDGCSLSRFQIMLHLYFDGPLQPFVIADRMAVTRGNITMFLRRMMNDNLVEPLAEGGGGRPPYCLTSHGQEVFEQILPRHIENVEALVKPLPSSILKQLKPSD